MAVSRYAKSVVAALVAGLTVLAAALTDDAITPAEWVQIAVAVLGAIGVYAVPNKPPAGEAADPRVSEQGAFNGSLLVVLAAGLVAIAALIFIVQNVSVR